MTPSALDPRGTHAETLAGLFWILFWAGLAVYVVVLALVVVPAWRTRRRQRAEADDTPTLDDAPGRPLVLVGGVVVPAVILVVLLVISAPIGPRILPAASDEERVVDVVGHMFWWEVRYPGDDGDDVVTANEIHVPVGEPVRVRMTASDVIHSFWVPQLHGKIDLTPGHGTSIQLVAEEAGVYRGQCAEFCGPSHAHMAFRVVAQEPDEFEDWLDAQAEPAAEPTDDDVRAGREVFRSSSCVYCHTVRGHGTASDVGPDLTHLASRQTIAAGVAPNERGHLGGWIVDPQSMKPGNRMPGTELGGAELQRLLDYLESLE